MLASGDVLVALLEADAAEFSIPSKVLSYLAAGRPVVGMMPAGNPAAHDIQTVGGVVVPPSHEGADTAAAWVASTSQDERATIGVAARHYAEQHFDVDKKAAEFNELIEAMLPKIPADMRVTAE